MGARQELLRGMTKVASQFDSGNGAIRVVEMMPRILRVSAVSKSQVLLFQNDLFLECQGLQDGAIDSG